MCAIFGFLNYGKKVSPNVLKNLLRALSVAAESRGTDATGISYVNNGNIVTFKKAKPAHKVKLYFPKDTTAVIGHTRFTTQGSEKHNYNNHPFEGTTDNHTFSLAHNGVLYNDSELRREMNLGYYINSPTYHNQLIPFMQGIKVTSISRKNIADTVIYYPTDIEEQQKIADFLSSYDEAITYAKQELDKWKQLKKGLLQQMFV